MVDGHLASAAAPSQCSAMDCRVLNIKFLLHSLILFLHIIKFQLFITNSHSGENSNNAMHCNGLQSNTRFLLHRFIISIGFYQSTPCQKATFHVMLLTQSLSTHLRHTTSKNGCLFLLISGFQGHRSFKGEQFLKKDSQ